MIATPGRASNIAAEGGVDEAVNDEELIALFGGADILVCPAIA